MANTPPLGWKNLKIGGVLHYNTPLRSLQPDGFSIQNPAEFQFFSKTPLIFKGACSFHDTRKTMKGVVCKRYFQIFENAKNYGYQ